MLTLIGWQEDEHVVGGRGVIVLVLGHGWLESEWRKLGQVGWW